MGAQQFYHEQDQEKIAKLERMLAATIGRNVALPDSTFLGRLDSETREWWEQHQAAEAARDKRKRYVDRLEQLLYRTVNVGFKPSQAVVALLRQAAEQHARDVHVEPEPPG